MRLPVTALLLAAAAAAAAASAPFRVPEPRACVGSAVEVRVSAVPAGHRLALVHDLPAGGGADAEVHKDTMLAFLGAGDVPAGATVRFETVRLKAGGRYAVAVCREHGLLRHHYYCNARDAARLETLAQHSEECLERNQRSLDAVPVGMLYEYPHIDQHVMLTTFGLHHAHLEFEIRAAARTAPGGSASFSIDVKTAEDPAGGPGGIGAEARVAGVGPKVNTRGECPVRVRVPAGVLLARMVVSLDKGAADAVAAASVSVKGFTLEPVYREDCSLPFVRLGEKVLNKLMYDPRKDDDGTGSWLHRAVVGVEGKISEEAHKYARRVLEGLEGTISETALLPVRSLIGGAAADPCLQAAIFAGLADPAHSQLKTRAGVHLAFGESKATVWAEDPTLARTLGRAAAAGRLEAEFDVLARVAGASRAAYNPAAKATAAIGLGALDALLAVARNRRDADGLVALAGRAEAALSALARLALSDRFASDSLVADPAVNPWWSFTGPHPASLSNRLTAFLLSTQPTVYTPRGSHRVPVLDEADAALRCRRLHDEESTPAPSRDAALDKARAETLQKAGEVIGRVKEARDEFDAHAGEIEAARAKAEAEAKKAAGAGAGAGGPSLVEWGGLSFLRPHKRHPEDRRRPEQWRLEEIEGLEIPFRGHKLAARRVELSAFGVTLETGPEAGSNGAGAQLTVRVDPSAAPDVPRFRLDLELTLDDDGARPLEETPRFHASVLLRKDASGTEAPLLLLGVAATADGRLLPRVDDAKLGQLLRFHADHEAPRQASFLRRLVSGAESVGVALVADLGDAALPLVLKAVNHYAAHAAGGLLGSPCAQQVLARGSVSPVPRLRAHVAFRDATLELGLRAAGLFGADAAATLPKSVRGSGFAVRPAVTPSTGRVAVQVRTGAGGAAFRELLARVGFFAAEAAETSPAAVAGQHLGIALQQYMSGDTPAPAAPGAPVTVAHSQLYLAEACVESKWRSFVASKPEDKAVAEWGAANLRVAGVRVREAARVEELRKMFGQAGRVLDGLTSQRDLYLAAARAAEEAAKERAATLAGDEYQNAVRDSRMRVWTTLNPFKIIGNYVRRGKARRHVKRTDARLAQLVMQANDERAAADKELANLVDEEEDLVQKMEAAAGKLRSLNE